VAFEEIATDVFVYLIIGGMIAVGTMCTTLYRCVHKQGQRGLRVSKAILLMAKSIDSYSKRNHPESDSDLYTQADLTLKNEKGEL